MYRVLKNLSTGHKAGEIIFQDELKEEVIEPLKRARAISEAQAPPLKSLPGWKERAEILERYNIFRADDFYETGDTLLRYVFKEPLEVIKNWKEEVIRFMK